MSRRALSVPVLGGFLMLAIPPAAADSLPAELAKAATTFVETLEPSQKATVQIAFDSDERLNWYFIPKDREGLSLEQMNGTQRRAALRLVEAGLSQKGYSKTEAIRALEPVLAELENDPVRRDMEKYYLTLFGVPSPTGTWGMRWEGHHVSLHWTIVEGRAIATTPQFLGSNPAEVRGGPRKGTRVLHAEEDLGRALVVALTDAQRAIALVSPNAPDDVLTSNSRRAAMQEKVGLAYADMTPTQRGLLISLIEEYASVQVPAVAAARVAKVKQAGLDAVTFAWMGGIEKGTPHYYRVQGPTFLIEYDCVQNGANHIHAVWRDFTGDFGVDLLEEHYRRSPHHRTRR